MLETVNLQLLCGGRTVCQPSWWNKTADAIDACYKFYFPLDGEATLLIDGRQHTLLPDRVYFISGYHIGHQSCAAPWEVTWIHFAPESLQLTWMLSQLPPFHVWDLETHPVRSTSLAAIERLFNPPATAGSGYDTLCRIVADRCAVQTLLLELLAALIGQFAPEQTPENTALFERLHPVVDYINYHLHARLTLATLADQAHLAPNYFHRMFTNTFGMTPLEYVTRRRLETARQFLTGTALSIREVGAKVGYPDEFYFSRVFKKHVKISPSEYRQQRGSL